MLHIQPTNLLLLAAKQEPYKKEKKEEKKAYHLAKNIKEFSGKSSAGRKKDKTDRVTGLGRRTRE